LIYQLRIELEGIYPRIWRRVEVPGELSLAALHLTIQHAMGWENSGLYAFRTRTLTYGAAHHHDMWMDDPRPVSYTHLRAHETVLDIVCRLLLAKKKKILRTSKDHITQLNHNHNPHSKHHSSAPPI